MVLYECNICNFNTKLKSNYLRHLDTKKHINNMVNQKSSKNIRQNKNMTLSDSDLTPDKKKYICNFLSETIFKK